MSYTSRYNKKNDCRKCSGSPHNDYLDHVTHSYVQAGLVDTSLKEPPSKIQSTTSSSSPCEKCNPGYCFAVDTSDGELDTQGQNQNGCSMLGKCSQRNLFLNSNTIYLCRNDEYSGFSMQRRIKGYVKQLRRRAKKAIIF